MSFSIFRLDWILIDSIIIVLLVVLLIIVKIFKRTHRWRGQFSNSELEIYKNHFFKSFEGANSFSNLFLLKNKLNPKVGKTTTIVFLHYNYIRKLPISLIEAFSTYGYNVLNLEQAFTFLRRSFLKKEHFGELFIEKIDDILEFYKDKGLIDDTNYALVSFNRSSLPYFKALNDPHCQQVILINPKSCQRNLLAMRRVFQNEKNRKNLSLIFSEHTYLFPNDDYKVFLEEFPTHENSIELVKNSSKTFKNYETILLGILQKLLE